MKIKTRERNNIEELSRRKEVDIINADMSRAYTFVCKYTTKMMRIIIYGIFKREKCINNF